MHDDAKDNSFKALKLKPNDGDVKKLYHLFILKIMIMKWLDLF